MPRHSRIDAPGAVHHVMVRGIVRGAIFYDNVDRERLIERAAMVLGEGKATCYAFALLSNHFHLLLRTGITPIAGIMSRLLTGYAVSFNARHRRAGHLFQNRYKSILCEEEPYLLELVRYIHLNPLRAGVVRDLDSLEFYPYSGHSAIMGRRERTWLDRGYVLKHFSDTIETARTLYRAFVEEGIAQGRRDDLTGGGLIRSNRGWRPSADSAHRKGDERILGGSDFVLEAIKAAGQTWERAHSLKKEDIDFAAVNEYVGRLFSLSPEEILLPGKYPNRVAARSTLCYFLVRELSLTVTAVAKTLGMSQPAVSIAVRRGEAIVKEKGLCLPARLSRLMEV
jgi:putative transposase